MKVRMSKNSRRIPLDFIADLVALSYLQTHIFLCSGYIIEITRGSMPLRLRAIGAYNVLRVGVDFSRFQP
jgi:hypothetical protein